MKMTATKCVSALFMTTVLAWCGMIPAQNRSAVTAVPHAPRSNSAGWADIIEGVRESVRLGHLPPEVIQYDLQIAQLIPEGEQIIASRDQAKARIWSKKVNAINVARNAAIGRVAVNDMASSNAAVGVRSSRKPDPCLSPMGRNICASPPAQQPGTSYSAGPGGIGASVGGVLVGPGGLGGAFGQ